MLAVTVLGACSTEPQQPGEAIAIATISPLPTTLPPSTTGNATVSTLASAGSLPDATTSTAAASGDGGSATTATATTSPYTAPPTVPTTAPRPTGPPSTVPTTSTPSGWRSQLVALINAARADAGVGPLESCSTLHRAAQDYSAVLAGWGRLAHVGPDGSTLASRVAAAGYSGYVTIGENLAAGQLDAATVVAAWMGSAGHRANLLYPGFTQIGGGRTDALSGGNTVPYWVLDLGVGGSC